MVTRCAYPFGLRQLSAWRKSRFVDNAPVPPAQSMGGGTGERPAGQPGIRVGAAHPPQPAPLPRQTSTGRTKSPPCGPCCTQVRSVARPVPAAPLAPASLPGRFTPTAATTPEPTAPCSAPAGSDIGSPDATGTTPASERSAGSSSRPSRSFTDSDACVSGEIRATSTRRSSSSPARSSAGDASGPH